MKREGKGERGGGLRTGRVAAAIVALVLPGLAACARGGEVAPPNVVVYLIDTLRADRLGCYGGARGLSPRIDAFARESVRFESARAQSSWTRPAVASVLSGRYPRWHGVHGYRDALPDGIPLLPGILREAGYETFAVTANPNTETAFGFARGFDGLKALPVDPASRGVHAGSDRVNEAVKDWLDGRSSPERPFFLFVHTMDPHDPYAPPAAERRRFAPEVLDPAVGSASHVAGLGALVAEERPRVAGWLRALHDAEIAFNDRSFGGFLDLLRSRGLLDRSIVVLLSDHGEEFLEHGSFLHGMTLFEEQLRIPLVVRLPSAEGGGRVVGTPVEQVDVLPTILDLVRLGAPPGIQGRSVAVSIRGAAGPPERPSFATLRLAGRDVDALVADGWKLIVDRRHGNRLFRLATDPAERNDLYGAEPEVARRLEALLAAGIERHGPEHDPGEPALSPAAWKAMREQLQALGYVQ